MAEEIQSPDNGVNADSHARTGFGRIGRNAVGLLLGTIFFIGSLLVLIWNEGCSLEAMRHLNPVLAPKPVEISGSISTDEVLSDEVFYLSVNAAKLIRVVEMYQWQENGDKEPSYHKLWSEVPIDSAAFITPQDHINPPMPYRSTEYSASVAQVGGVTLAPQIIEQLGGAEDYPLTRDSFAKINPALAGFKLNEGEYYRGNPARRPEIGDVRVHFKALLPGDHVDVSGQLKDGRLEVMKDAGHKAMSHNSAMTWGFRFGGWLAMFTGLMLVFVSLQIYGSKVPVLGNMAAFGIKLIAMVMATVLTLIIIAMIWFSYSPATSMVLLMVASGVIIMSTFVKPKREAPIPVAVKYFKVPRQNLASPHILAETR